MDEPDTVLPGVRSATRALPTEARDQINHDASELSKAAKETLSTVKEEATDQLDNIKERAGEQLSLAADSAKTFAGKQKDAAGDQLEGVATAISKAADELQNQPVVAGYAHDLADGIKRVSDTVKTRNVDELLAMAEDFGRTQPVAFLGAAALAGFVASRFVLSSANRRKTAADTETRPTNEGVGTTQESWSPVTSGGR